MDVGPDRRETPFREHRLAEKHRPGVTEPSDDRGVSFGVRLLRGRAERRRQARDVVLVFDEVGHAIERPERASTSMTSRRCVRFGARSIGM
jgi:hypothetical protein